MPNLRQCLYQLKKDYGEGPLSIYQLLSTTADAETGERQAVADVVILPRVIVLPARVQREVVQTISQISANKAFVYGGNFDSRTRVFIIELDELKQDDWLVFAGKKYQIKSVQEFGESALVVTARHLLGDVGEQIFPLAADHLLSLSQAATAQL